jgi:tRNA-dihydrouridine synthase 4
MMEKALSHKERKSMNNCNSLVELLDWFETRFDLKRRGQDGFGSGVEFPWRADRKTFLEEE